MIARQHAREGMPVSRKLGREFDCITERCEAIDIQSQVERASYREPADATRNRLFNSSHAGRRMQCAWSGVWIKKRRP